VRFRPTATVSSSAGPLALAAAGVLASGQTNLQETNALVWVMVAASATGAIITFSFLVYSLWKFRDPKVKNRRYG
jgi:heme/copper-type cytochrome/quinol oxidase subunit 2